MNERILFSGGLLLINSILAFGCWNDGKPAFAGLFGTLAVLEGAIFWMRWQDR